MAIAWLPIIFIDDVIWINGFTPRCFQTLKAHYPHHKVNAAFNCCFFRFFPDLSAIWNRISFSWSWQTALYHSTKFWKERAHKIHVQQPTTTTATCSWYGSTTNNAQYRLGYFTMSSLTSALTCDQTPCLLTFLDSLW